MLLREKYALESLSRSRCPTFSITRQPRVFKTKWSATASPTSFANEVMLRDVSWVFCSHFIVWLNSLNSPITKETHLTCEHIFTISLWHTTRNITLIRLRCNFLIFSISILNLPIVDDRNKKREKQKVIFFHLCVFNDSTLHYCDNYIVSLCVYLLWLIKNTYTTFPYARCAHSDIPRSFIHKTTIYLTIKMNQQWNGNSI